MRTSKKRFSLFASFVIAASVLAACSSSETPAPSTSGDLGLSNDPFLAAEETSGTPTDTSLNADSSTGATDATDSAAATSSTDASLATPVDGSSSSDSLVSTSSSGETSASSASSLSEPTPPGPPPPPNAMAATPSNGSSGTDLPSPGSAPAAAPPVVQNSGGVDDRTLYQQYLEFQEKRKQREALDDSLETRSLFPHEDGSWQFGLDYAHDAFRGYDFDSTANRLFADTMGAQLSISYFPLRSMVYGRLGAGINAGAYWSKFSYVNNSTGLSDTTRKHTIDVVGAKLQYEFQYFVGQILVPFAYLGYESGRVSTLNIPTNAGTFPKQSFNSQNYGGGVHLNLNRLERRAASRALASSGIRKFYLSYTYQKKEMMEEADHLLGLRFEY